MDWWVYHLTWPELPKSKHASKRLTFACPPKSTLNEALLQGPSESPSVVDLKGRGGGDFEGQRESGMWMCQPLMPNMMHQKIQ